MTWREEAREDRAAAGQEKRATFVAMAEQRRKDSDAAAKRQRTEQDAKRARAVARRAAVAGWFKANVLELLFVPVIVVPAVLAWPAMAAYGITIFGSAGMLLPGFTEGAMWAFAWAIALAQRHNRPTWALQLGVWVSAAMAGGMNFLHGYSGPSGSVAHGLVMAVVSIGGVIVHQLISARPMRPRLSREDRNAAKVTRQAAKRVLAVRHAAVRQAVAELAADGTARLVYRPGMVTLARSRAGRSRLTSAIVPGLPTAPLPDIDPLTDELEREIHNYLSTLPAGNNGNTLGTAQTRESAPIPPSIAKRLPGLLTRVRAAIDAGKLPAHPTRGQVQKFLRCRAEVAVVVTNTLHDDGNGQEAAA
jgi:hypothetical protein